MGFRRSVGASIESAEISDGAVTTPKLAAGAVTAEKAAADMATQAELDAHVSDNANPHGVTAAGIGALADAAGSVGSSHLAAGAVIAGKIGASAVTATEIATDAVITGKIVDQAVRTEKLGKNHVQIMRKTGITVNAASENTETCTWPTAFLDANYFPVAMAVHGGGASRDVVIKRVQSWTASSVVVVIANDGALSATGVEIVVFGMRPHA